MIEHELPVPHHEATHAIRLGPEDFEGCRAIFCSVLRPALPLSSTTWSEDTTPLVLEPAGEPCEPLAIRYQLPSGEKSPTYAFNPDTLAYECGDDAFMVVSLNDVVDHAYVSWSDFLAINSEAARAGLRHVPLDGHPELVNEAEARSQVLLGPVSTPRSDAEARLMRVYMLRPWTELGHLEISPGLWDRLWADAKDAAIWDEVIFES